ncbi:unnamed protein product [Thelazia callipaeda]|uniref:PDZ domain-containing protein n=1 Tax=Thelazia callipaeda TaxID=103827 RepID=A0A3P7LD12_THECL|nr:unnamed protein product [Thelazia callipaeda]
METLADGTVHEHRVITSLPHKGHNLKFQVQLAHGSPTGIIYGFTNIMQLYELIADCYDEITVDDILFCTVNTHRVCMDALMSSNISNDDLIFAHIAGQKKEVTLVKTNPALGLTIADNGIGKAFIKRIVPGTVTSDANPALQVGDFIEKVNDDSMVGRRHFDVARYLRSLPVGSTSEKKRSPIADKSIEPKRTGFNTIRFKSDGTVLVQEVITKNSVVCFDSLLLRHGSINEEIINELNCTEQINFIFQSDVNDFNFPEEFFFDIWRIRSDWKNSRLTQRQANVSTADETLAPDKATDLHAGTSE